MVPKLTEAKGIDAKNTADAATSADAIRAARGEMKKLRSRIGLSFP
ncbi:MAG: hypothetical protein ACOX7B_00840 [Christensenellales bacterium]